MQELCQEELKRGIMGVDPSLPSTITAFPPGYIDRDKEVGHTCPSSLGHSCTSSHAEDGVMLSARGLQRHWGARRQKFSTRWPQSCLRMRPPHPQQVIVGMQTDEPLKRAIKPLGGVNVVKAALEGA